MKMKSVSRRGALLGAAAMLSGCSSLDGLLGSRKTPLPGDRRSVLSADPPLAVDTGLEGRRPAGHQAMRPAMRCSPPSRARPGGPPPAAAPATGSSSPPAP
jgi:hypothetical protein